MKARITEHRLILAHPFGLSTGTSHERRSFSIEVADREGTVGRGEATPLHYMGETPESLRRELDRVAAFLASRKDAVENALGEAAGAPVDRSASPLAALDAHIAAALPGSAAARCALSTALHDLLACRLSLSLRDLLGISGAPAPASFTVALDDVEAMVDRAREAVAAGFGVLKVKLGRGDGASDLKIVKAIRSVHSGRLLVDANGGWSVASARELATRLADLGVEAIEQPLPRGERAGMAEVARQSPLPILADEDSLDLADLDHLPAEVGGINVKLMKCGGIVPALAMIRWARARGRRVMLGCMVQSSLGITAAAHLAPLVDLADLDGAALLANDPFEGMRFEKGRIVLPGGPGVGAVPRSP